MATVHVVAGSVAAAFVPPLTQHIIQDIDDVMHMKRNREVLKTDLNRIKSLIEDISSYSEHQQNELPQTVQNGLQSLRDALQMAKLLVDRPQQCLCDITLPRRIRKLNAEFDKLFGDLRTDFAIVRAAAPAVQGTGVSSIGNWNVDYQGRRRRITIKTNWKWSAFKRESQGQNAPAPLKPDAPAPLKSI